ncbi:MAG: hypothetical protein GY870_11475 [archaeon]|nr:hypothetical protein [archaeon]
MEEKNDIKKLMTKKIRAKQVWGLIFFGLFIQALQNWKYFLTSSPNLLNWMEYSIFIWAGIWFLIGIIGNLYFDLKIKSLSNEHKHEFNEKTFHCKICGIYWNQKSCLFCNSNNISYIQSKNDFGYFIQKINMVSCNECGKKLPIDSFSTAIVKGVK